MLLVDSNIIFSALVQNMQWHRAARELHSLDSDWRTESHALVEMSNVLSRYVRAGELTAAEAIVLMGEADQLMRPSILTVDHTQALGMAIKYMVSAYDARFLVCALALNVRLMTEDAKLRRAAPALTRSLNEALAGEG